MIASFSACDSPPAQNPLGPALPLALVAAGPQTLVADHPEVSIGLGGMLAPLLPSPFAGISTRETPIADSAKKTQQRELDC